MVNFSIRSFRELFRLLKQKSLKEIFLGHKVVLGKAEQKLLQWIKGHPGRFRRQGGRAGRFVKLNLLHKGAGTVYLLPNKLTGHKAESLLLFEPEVKIQPGPDLYVYLSTKTAVRDSLGKIYNLGLLKGTAGGQSYVIRKNIRELQKYKSAVIYCKKFKVLFTYALLK
ncbi:MAG TPA: DM13 domain-containing protein [Candidatus Nanoarchaeia archaeon]|nr:DM13 domain-containing protein [Candidatus Nanoarchaeia archaeon]